MSTKIRIDGRFNQTMVTNVKNLLREIPKDETEVIFVVNSCGGSRLALERLKGFMYFIEKYRKCKIIGQLEHGESAGLLFFLNCTERQVSNKSIGVIHFPIEQVSRKSLDLKNRIVVNIISFIKRRTQNKMSEEEIIKLQNVELNADEMLNLGIATKKFDEVTAEPKK